MDNYQLEYIGIHLFCIRDKRENDIKDYGTIFPGHGGVMDRFDSIIAVAPVILGIAVIFGVKLIY